MSKTKKVCLTACSHEREIFVLKDRELIIKTAVEILKTWRKDFDAIAVSGYSSALTASIVASKLRKNIVLVRKDCESRNSSYNVEGIHGQRVLFFDDLISSGDTMKRIRDGIKTIRCNLVGFYLYKHGWREYCNDIVPGIIKMDIPKES